MISESRYWKQPLLETADRLEALRAANEPSDEEFADIERDIFIGFYSARKLLETRTMVTDSARELKVDVAWHPNRQRVNLMHKSRIEEFYDLEVTQNEQRDLRFVCGRVIHSFIFLLLVEEQGGLYGIMFTSDTDKNKKLYDLKIGTVIDIFRTVGNDWPRRVDMCEDDATGDVEAHVS